MQIRDTFAANMRRYRKDAGLSQEQLAERAGLHRTYIGGIEQRRVNVSLKNIGKIAEALEVDPAALFLETVPGDTTAAWREASRRIDEAGGRLREADAAGRLREGVAKGRLREGVAKGRLREGVAQNLPANATVAIAALTEDGVEFEPVEAAYEDLTVHILVSLIERGFTGPELVREYRKTSREIKRFLRVSNPPSL